MSFGNIALMGDTLLKVSFTILRSDRRGDNSHDDISTSLYRDSRKTSPRRGKVLAFSHSAVIRKLRMALQVMPAGWEHRRELNQESAAEST